ncbi:MAG: hypothetical protein ACLQIQ_07500 [Beijerinckiaceae bacterium]
MNVRMLPPVAVNQQARTVNGRTYSGTPGTVQDIPDFDANALAANGWINVAFSGPTSARPTATVAPYAATAGLPFYDTTLGKVIVYDGATWRDPTNGNSV